MDTLAEADFEGREGAARGRRPPHGEPTRDPPCDRSPPHSRSVVRDVQEASSGTLRRSGGARLLPESVQSYRRYLTLRPEFRSGFLLRRFLGARDAARTATTAIERRKRTLKPRRIGWLQRASTAKPAGIGTTSTWALTPRKRPLRHPDPNASRRRASRTVRPPTVEPRRSSTTT